MDSAVEILDLSLLCTETDYPLAGWIDAPTVGDRVDGYHLRITGWVVGQHSPARTVKCRVAGAVLRVVPVDVPRPDVAAIFPGVARAAVAGFLIDLSVLGLPPVFTMQMDAVLEDGKSVPLAEIHGRRTPLHAKLHATYSPVMVTCLGRSGTTLLMQMLADHPEIVVQRIHPYETRYASYWMHLLDVLASPGEGMKAVEWIPYFGNTEAVRRNPFAHWQYPHPAPVRRWFEKEYVEEFAAFSQKSIDGFYREVASSQHEHDARFYAEKVYPDRVPDLLWETNAHARELFSVRDCRDMFCSIKGFIQNSERTFLGYADVDRAEEFIAELRRDISLLLASWRRRSQHAYLVRYEDLVMQPTETLRGICAYLGMDASPTTLDAIVGRAFADTHEYRGHRTSTSVEASVGRWRRELSPPLQRLCEETYADMLTEFGYMAAQ